MKKIEINRPGRFAMKTRGLPGKPARVITVEVAVKRRPRKPR
jgi:hypothetical protein